MVATTVMMAFFAVFKTREMATPALAVKAFLVHRGKSIVTRNSNSKVVLSHTPVTDAVLDRLVSYTPCAGLNVESTKMKSQQNTALQTAIIDAGLAVTRVLLAMRRDPQINDAYCCPVSQYSIWQR